MTRLLFRKSAELGYTDVTTHGKLAIFSGASATSSDDAFED
jgi:hypothetical protein